MKFLVLIAVLAIAYLLWRNARLERKAAPPPAAKPPAAGAGALQDMVQCPVCAVHLPRMDALPGPDGAHYCSQEHRQRAGH
jgi:uncharacterized protein